MGVDLSILSKKLGPLPVGGWLAVGAGGIYVGRIWSGRTARPAAATPLGGVAVDGAVAPGGTDVAADTNDAWSRRVIAALIAEGVEPTAAQRAIVNFLNGYPLTLSESLIVDRALLIGGVPPEGVPPASIESDTTPTQDGGGTTSPIGSSTPPSTDQAYTNLASPFHLATPVLAPAGSTLSVISNPVGSADADAGPYYAPSLLDYATELQGGLASAWTPGGGTVYTNFTGGTGPYVAPADRIPGERYDATGHIIY